MALPGNVSDIAASALETIGGRQSIVFRQQLTHMLTDAKAMPRAFLMIKNQVIDDPMLIFGPQLAAPIIYAGLTGAVVCLSVIYFIYFSGKKGDRWFLQAGVIVAVIIYLLNTGLLVHNFYRRMLQATLDPDGWGMQNIGLETIVVAMLEVIPLTLGQLYFLARTAKFFVRRRNLYLAIGAFSIVVQLVFAYLCLIIWTRTLDWYLMLSDPFLYSINTVSLSGYSVMMVINEVFLSGSLFYKLCHLRAHSGLASAHSVMYKIGLLAMQSNLVLVASAIFVLVVHSTQGSTGWFLAMMYTQCPVHTIFVLINLIYRRSMISELAQESGELRVSVPRPAAATSLVVQNTSSAHEESRATRDRIWSSKTEVSDVVFDMLTPKEEERAASVCASSPGHGEAQDHYSFSYSQNDGRQQQQQQQHRVLRPREFAAMHHPARAHTQVATASGASDYDQSSPSPSGEPAYNADPSVSVPVSGLRKTPSRVGFI